MRYYTEVYKELGPNDTAKNFYDDQVKVKSRFSKDMISESNKSLSNKISSITFTECEFRDYYIGDADDSEVSIDYNNDAFIEIYEEEYGAFCVFGIYIETSKILCSGELDELTLLLGKIVELESGVGFVEI